ncbi:MAG: type II toxin-antitoxin system RelE/ParE family toxin [Saprospiraceae bacterium]|nr:type II toxin-antitoxin system RelE/ParE family toxin [Saprospiraceae bacterium]MCB9326187.1 type II toxin-antitoxin system RelE/ParE family toxin [Lewinellaceae bacterium]
MSFIVMWSPEAKSEYAEILSFIEQGWGEGSALKLLDRTEEIIDHISRHPKMYPSTSVKKNIHKAVITSNLSLIYKVKPKAIHLLHFWDNRKNPQNLETL